MSSHSSVDKAPTRCSGGHGFDSCQGFFLCPMLVTCVSIHFSHFITKLKKFTIFIHLSLVYPVPDVFSFLLSPQISCMFSCLFPSQKNHYCYYFLWMNVSQISSFWIQKLLIFSCNLKELNFMSLSLPAMYRICTRHVQMKDISQHTVHF